LVIDDPSTGFPFPAETTNVNDSENMENGTLSSLLIFSGVPIAEGTDYDVDDDGSLELLPAGAVVLDAVAWWDGDAGDLMYGGVVLTQNAGIPPDAATRFLGNTMTNTVSAWFNGDLLPSNGVTSTVYQANEASGNMPANAALTPGAENDLTVCLAPTAPTGTIAQNSDDVVLNFNSPDADFYNVWVETNPYYTPSPVSMDVVLATTNTTVTDTNQIGDTTLNYYYLVQAVSQCGAATAIHQAEFDFAIVPGTP
jgi:hypothetical protein